MRKRGVRNDLRATSPEIERQRSVKVPCIFAGETTGGSILSPFVLFWTVTDFQVTDFLYRATLHLKQKLKWISVFRSIP